MYHITRWSVIQHGYKLLCTYGKPSVSVIWKSTLVAALLATLLSFLADHHLYNFAVRSCQDELSVLLHRLYQIIFYMGSLR
jgi:hypothetical protein